MLKHASVIISLVLAGLYALGLSFHQSYLSFLGLEETQFQFSIDRLFFQGFFAAADISASGLTWLVLAASGIVIIANVGMLIVEVINKFNFSSLLPTWLLEPTDTSKHPFVEFSLKMFAYVVFVFCTYLALLLVIIASSNSGESYAKKFKLNVKNNELKLLEIQLKDSTVLEGYAIICSETQCAYWVNSKSIVFNKRDIASSGVK